MAITAHRKALGIALMVLLGTMTVLNMRNGLRYRQMQAEYERMVTRAMEECFGGNRNSTIRLLQRAGSLAPDSASEDYVRELDLRFRAGDCTLTQSSTLGNQVLLP